jgi:glucokinase
VTHGDPSPGPGPTIGVDLGGTNLRVAVVDAAGTILDEEHSPTPKDWPSLVDALADAVGQFLKDDDEIGAVGMGAAGLVDREGTVHYAPNIPMLVDAPLGGELATRLAVPVIVDNDANVAAWGEVCHGAAKGARDALVITLGTGVGGGIVLDGRIYRGAHGFAAEVGHWQVDPHGAMCACGEVGHWESTASGTALGRMARERAAAGEAPGVLARANGDIGQVSGRMVGDSARAGEADGLAILGDYAHNVAIGFAGLANILDPEVIVVSGGLVELGDLLFDPLHAAFLGHLEGSAHRPAVPVLPAALGEQSGVIGAAALARSLVP